jgi:hypothetical protein
MTSIRKKTVELNTQSRTSRIRREPVRAEQIQEQRAAMFLGRIDLSSREWEIALGIGGVIAFALALEIIWFGVSAWMAR